MSESNKRSHSTTKRNTVAVVAIILVCILAIGGTIAYLTSHSQLTNTFTVGQISPIDPEKPGPDPENPGPDGEKPIPEEDKNDKTKLNGNLYEPSWIKDSKLLPSATIAKDPYVGVGPGSEASVVYVYVNNTMTNNDHIYFTIDTANWEPVVGQATPVSGDNYTSGLFKYKYDLDASKETKNVWTATPLFKNVEVSKDAKAEDFQKNDAPDEVGAIEVNAFLHQKYNADGQSIADQTILDAVKAQFGLN